MFLLRLPKPLWPFLPAALAAVLLAVPARAAAPSYRFPSARQGVTDLLYTPDDLEARYAALAKLGLGLKTYNLFWAALENAGVPSASVPMSCPGGTTRIPADTQEKDRQGYRRFHCYNTQAIANFDRLLGLDKRYGWQSVAVLFNTPAQYRTPGCVASADGLDVGCAPDESHLDDWEDYVNFLVWHYDGSSAAGKISHFIVWNEVQNGTWFNLSPSIDVRHPLRDPVQVQAWVDRYVRLFERAGAALGRHPSGALLHVSLNLYFRREQPAGQTLAAPDIGGKTILDGLWAQIGTRFGWSVAMHPYFEPWVQYGPDIINFAGLANLTRYQEAQLRARGVARPQAAQQSFILASEQGWFDVPLSLRAGNICRAHATVLSMPNVIGATHNFFQSRTPADDGEALIPYAAGTRLQNNPGQYPTYQAYRSTSPKVWGARNDHFCCQNYYLGCSTDPNTSPPVAPQAKVMGVIDGVVQGPGGAVVRGWACNAGDPDPLAVDLYLGGPAGVGRMAGRTLTHLPSEPAIARACGTRGTCHRFEIDLAGWHASAARAPIYIYGISSTGGTNLALERSGTFYVP